MDEILEKIEYLYTSSLTAHGCQSKAVGWKTRESQELRFEKLTRLILDRSKSITINDYGCGYGAFLEYLTRSGIEVSEYNGYDLSDEMLSVAKQHLSWFEGRLNVIRSSEISTMANYTFVSGTFNVRFKATNTEWRRFIEEKLIQINKYSTEGFAFNLLSTYVDWKESHLYYGDPCFWFEFVKSRLARKVDLLHSYPLYEWTLVAFKETK